MFLETLIKLIMFGHTFIFKNRGVAWLIDDLLNLSIFVQKTTYRLNGADAGNFIFKLLIT